MHLISQDHQEWKTLNLDCGFWAEIKEYSNDLGLYARYSCDLYETRSLYYFSKKNIRRPFRQKVRVDYLHFQLDQSCQWVFNWSHTHMYVCNQSIQRSYRHRIIASLFNFNVCQNNLIEMEEMNSMNDI